MRQPFPFYKLSEEMLRKTAASTRYARQNTEGEKGTKNAKGAKDAKAAKAAKAKGRRTVRLFTHDGLGGLGLLPGRSVGTTGARDDDAGPVGQRRPLHGCPIDGGVGVAALPGDAAGVGD